MASNFVGTEANRRALSCVSASGGPMWRSAKRQPHAASASPRRCCGMTIHGCNTSANQCSLGHTTSRILFPRHAPEDPAYSVCRSSKCQLLLFWCEMDNAESFALCLRQQNSTDDHPQLNRIRRRPNHRDRSCLRFCALEHRGPTRQLCVGSEPR